MCQLPAFLEKMSGKKKLKKKNGMNAFFIKKWEKKGVRKNNAAS